MVMGYINLYLIHGPCPIGEEGNLWLPEGIRRSSTQKYFTFDVSHMEESIGSGLSLPVIHQVYMPRYPRIHACYSDWQIYFTRRIASEVCHFAFFGLCKPENAWKCLKATSKKSWVPTLKKPVVVGPGKSKKSKEKLKKSRTIN